MSFIPRVRLTVGFNICGTHWFLQEGMTTMKKYVAECIGTLILVLFGCGTAVVTGGLTGGTGAGTLGVVAIALAFGLSIVACAYVVGKVSGCHINPAVSIGMLVAGRMTGKDFVGYIIAQFAGGIAGAVLLKTIVASATGLTAAAGLGQNGFGDASAVGLSMGGAILVEVILTFVFVFAALGVTSSERTAGAAGLVIGGTLAFVHILGIPLTGTSVNPARSFGPALFAGGEALSQVWVFILAPLMGGILAAVVYMAVIQTRDEKAALKK